MKIVDIALLGLEAPQLLDASERGAEERDGRNPHTTDMMALCQVFWNRRAGAACCL
jgi:hypothetical protein